MAKDRFAVRNQEARPVRMIRHENRLPRWRGSRATLIDHVTVSTAQKLLWGLLCKKTQR